MKTELFKKVYIRSEDDLPKEAGFYFIHYKHHDERIHTQMSVVYYDESIKGLWFGKDWYDWYLQPIEEEPQPLQDNEIPTDCKLCKYHPSNKTSASIDDIQTYLKNRVGDLSCISTYKMAVIIQEFIAQWVLPSQSYHWYDSVRDAKSNKPKKIKKYSTWEDWCGDVV